MADDTVRGRFVWHELLTPNREGAHAFYERIVGWKAQPWEHDASYRMFAAASGPLGASVEQRDGTPQWVPYIGADDVDAVIEAATRKGAKVVTQPTTLPNAGRYAVLVDPHGATFGVHGSPSAPTPEAEPRIGEFEWHELATNVAPEDAFAFYTELFGWQEIGRYDMGSAGVYLLFGRNGRRMGGMFNRAQTGRSGPAHWVGYVSVENLDAAVDRAKASRASVLMEPMEVPGGDRVAQLADPHGALFALVERARADSARASADDAARTSAASADAGAREQRGAKKAAAKKASTKKAGAKKAARAKQSARTKRRAPKKAARASKAAAKKGRKKATRKAAKKTAKRAAAKRASRKTSGAAKKRGAGKKRARSGGRARRR